MEEQCWHNASYVQRVGCLDERSYEAQCMMDDVPESVPLRQKTYEEKLGFFPKD